MGFQRLRICPYEYPVAWRLCIAPRAAFSLKNGAYVNSWGEYPTYSSSEELKCFGWQEAGDCAPERLAQLFVERFAKTCEAGRGRDWEYAGWLSELSGHVSRTRQLPFVHAEYFEPGPEELTYLPLRAYEGDQQIAEFPLPPSPDPSLRALVDERDDLRRRVAELEKKVAAAKNALN